MLLDDEGPNWRVIGVVVTLVLLGGVAFASFGIRVDKVLSTVGASVGPPDGGYVAQPPEPGAGEIPEDPGAQAPEVPPGQDVPLYSIDRSDLLIIKTGSLTLQVSAIDPALADATSLVSSLGGYASGSDRTGDGDRLAATITFRIPAPKWEEAFVRLRGLANRVLAEHSETDDVTGQVVDLGARIRNLGATEQALQAIMDRAGTIKDVLSVQQELTSVRGQIEELTAQKAHLEEQAALSTLAVTFSMQPEPVLAVQQAQFDPGAEAERASASLVSVLQDVATAGIWFGIVWLPIFLAMSIVGGGVLLVARRFRRAGPGGETPVAPAAEGGT